MNFIAKLFEVSSKMIFSEIVNADDIEKYNGMKSIFDNASTIIAPALGTLVYGIYGFRMVLLVFQNKFAAFRKNLNRLFLVNRGIMIGIGSLCLTDVPALYFVLFLGAQFLLGAVTTCINVPLLSYFQVNIPIHYQGRIFSLMTAVSGL